MLAIVTWHSHLLSHGLEELMHLLWCGVQVDDSLAGPLAVLAGPGGDGAQALLRAADDDATICHLVLGGFPVVAEVAMQPKRFGVHPEEGDEVKRKMKIMKSYLTTDF